MSTIIDILAVPHVAALCRALDEGDDSVLPILADALEEIGDGRAAGMHRVGSIVTDGACRWPLNFPADRAGRSAYRHRWAKGRQYVGGLPPEIFERLRGGKEVFWRSVAICEGHRPPKVPQMCYPTRSAAFIALAAALS